MPPFESATGSSSGGALKTTTRAPAGHRQRLVLDPGRAREDLARGVARLRRDRARACGAGPCSRASTSELRYERHDDQVDDRERAADDDEQREREPSADRAERVHRSRKRYPTLRTVRMYSGLRESRSSFSRRWRTWTSIVRGSRNSALPQSASSSIRR